MSARITAGMLCYLARMTNEAQPYNGRVVTTLRYLGDQTNLKDWTEVPNAWEVACPWDGLKRWATERCLIPIAPPGIDTTETSDALHDSLVAVLAEARPV